MAYFSKQIFCCATILFVLAMPALAAAREHTVGVLLSREIRPYVSMVEGLETHLGEFPVQRFFLDDKGRPYSLAGRRASLTFSQFDVMVAVGPEALSYLVASASDVPVVYGMILNPEKLITESGSSPCGVTLNLSIETQIFTMLQYFPEMARLGVLYDPVNNQGWFDNAADLAAGMGVELIPLQVSRQSDRLDIIGDLTLPDAILFIPDKTIISKVVIQHVIKEAVLRRIPVVGYNRFFSDSGATLSFIIDYNQVGRQVAAQVQQLLAGEVCQTAIAPQFNILVNNDAWRVLGLSGVDGKANVEAED